ncbi:MAG: hypothetical protein AAGH41_13025 [Pseudomonadota bacterium]
MRILPAAVAAIALLTPAHAAQLIGVVGEVWESSTTLNNITDARAAITGSPAAMFDVTNLDYPNTDADNVDASNSTLADFLGVDGGSIVGTNLSELNNTVFRFSGSIRVDAFGDAWSVGSDDGFELVVDGGVIGANPGARSFGTTTGTIDLNPGVYTFELVYFERTGATGVELKLNDEIADNTAVPVPGAAVLMGGVLAAGAARRKRQS